LRLIGGATHAPPTIVLSACTYETDRLAAFRLGARDYVCKPFSVLELLARIDLHLNLSLNADRSDELLLINCERREVSYRNNTIDLTRLEFDILVTLARTTGRAVVGKAYLLNEVWNLPGDWNTRTHEVHVNNLRHKLARHGLTDAIKTVQRQGYRLDVAHKIWLLAVLSG
jgi:two-component system, OmpR family, phosphate regulon response regulator PhoB